MKHKTPQEPVDDRLDRIMARMADVAFEIRQMRLAMDEKIERIMTALKTTGDEF